MGLFKKILSISFKEKSVFRFDYIVSTLYSFFSILLKVSLWKGLYGNGGGAINGIVLNDMIVYSILSSFTQGITNTSVMNDLNSSVLDGSISSGLLLPIGLKKYMFINSLTKNLFLTIYGIVPSVSAAMLFFGFHPNIRLSNLVLYIFSVIMGILINFLYNFLFGSSVIWLRNSFFLKNINIMIQLIATVLVPYGFINFYPLQALLGKSDGEYWRSMAGWCPLVSISFFMISCLFFNRNARQYKSSGS